MKRRTIGMFIGVFIVGVSMGTLISQTPAVQAIPNTNIGIAPTDAMQDIWVQTSWWAADDTLVTSDTYDQQIYFATDGSVILNVTTVDELP